MNKFLEFIKRIFKLEERVGSIIRLGTIKEIDLESNLVIVDLGNNLETPKLPYLVSSSGNAGVYFVPKVDDQVIVLSPNGDIIKAVILPSVCKGNIAGVSDEWRLEFSQGSIKYKEGKLEINSSLEVKLDAPKVVLVGEDGGGAVGGNHICAFTGGPHPQCSAKVFLGS